MTICLKLLSFYDPFRLQALHDMNGQTHQFDMKYIYLSSCEGHLTPFPQPAEPVVCRNMESQSRTEVDLPLMYPGQCWLCHRYTKSPGDQIIYNLMKKVFSFSHDNTSKHSPPTQEIVDFSRENVLEYWTIEDRPSLLK